MLLIATCVLPSFGRTHLVNALRAAYSEAVSSNLLYPRFQYLLEVSSVTTRQTFATTPENYADLNELCSVSAGYYPNLDYIVSGSALDYLLTHDTKLKIGVLEAYGVDASTFPFYLESLQTLVQLLQRHYNSSTLISFDVHYGYKGTDGYDFVFGVSNTDWHSQYYPLCSVIPNRVGVLTQNLPTTAAYCVDFADLTSRKFVVMQNSKHYQILDQKSISPVVVYSAEALVNEVKNDADSVAFADFYYLKAAAIKNASLHLAEFCPGTLRSNFWVEPQRILLLPDTEIPASIVHDKLQQKTRKKYYDMSLGYFYGNHALKYVISKALSNGIYQLYFGYLQYPFSLRAAQIPSLQNISLEQYGVSCEPELPDLYYITYDAVTENSLLSQVLAQQRIRIAVNTGLFDTATENDLVHTKLDKSTPLETYLTVILAAELSNYYGIMIRPVLVHIDAYDGELLGLMHRFGSFKQSYDEAQFDIVFSSVEMTLSHINAANFGLAYLRYPLRAVSVREITNFEALAAVELVYVKENTVSFDLLAAVGANYQVCADDADCLAKLDASNSNVYLTSVFVDAPSKFKKNVMPELAQMGFAVRFDDGHIQGIRDELGRGVGTLSLILASCAFAVSILTILRLGKRRNERK